MMVASGPKDTNDGGEVLRTEYAALAQYFGTVIGFRFTAAGLFLAGAAFLIPKVHEMGWPGYLLLFGIGVGMWIVELRNRSVIHLLLKQGRAIEAEWGYPQSSERFGLFGAMRSEEAAREARERNVEFSKIPVPALTPTRVLWFAPTMAFAKYLTHTVGLDLLYLGVIIFAGFGLLGWTGQQAEYVAQGETHMLWVVIVGTLSGVAIIAQGRGIIQAMITKDADWRASVFAIGCALIVGGIIVSGGAVGLGLMRMQGDAGLAAEPAQPCEGRQRSVGSSDDETTAVEESDTRSEVGAAGR